LLDFGVIEILGLASSFVVLAIFFNLAFNSTKLNSSTHYAGTEILKWSCWCLALIWLPLLFLTYFIETENTEPYLALLTILPTIPMITAAYGFRVFVKDISKERSTQSDRQA